MNKESWARVIVQWKQDSDSNNKLLDETEEINAEATSEESDNDSEQGR